MNEWTLLGEFSVFNAVFNNTQDNSSYSSKQKGGLTTPREGGRSMKLIARPHFFIACLLIKPLNAELLVNPICHLLALIGVHHFLHVSKIRVKSLSLRLLMSYIYIYGAPILDVSRSHTTTQHSR